MTYTARTDNCELGTESGCIPGATAGEAGAPLSFLYRPTDTPPFAANVPANTDATDPDFGSHLVLLTDTSTSKTTVSYNESDIGDWGAFSSNTGMLLMHSDNGFMDLLYLDPIYARTAKSGRANCLPTDTWPNACSAVSQIKSGTPGSCTAGCTIMSVGGETFSRTDPYKIFELDYAGTPGSVAVNALEICPLSGTGPYCYPNVASPLATADTFSRVLYQQAVPGILPSNYLATWNGVFATAADDSFTLALAGGADRLPSTYYIVNDWTSFIVPQTYNTHHYAFMVTVAGTTSSTTNSALASTFWNSCEAAGSCTDGGVTWTYIGIVAGQGQGYDLINYTAGVGWSAANTYIGQVRRSTSAYAAWGNGEPPWPGGWPTSSSTPSGYWQTDDPLLCQPYGVTPANPPSGTCHLTSTPALLHDAHALINSTFTKIGDTSSASTTNFQGGFFMSVPSYYTGPWVSGFSYTSTADVVYDPTIIDTTGLVFYSPISASSGSPLAGTTPPSLDPTHWTYAAGLGYGKIWQVPTLTFRECVQNNCGLHAEEGYLNEWKGAAYSQFSFAQPSYYVCQTSATPHTLYALNTTTYPTTGCAAGDWIIDEIYPGNICTVPSTAPGATCVIGSSYTNGWHSNEVMPNPLPSDNHESMQAPGTNDSGIIAFFLGAVPSPGQGIPGSPAMQTYNQEIVGGTTGLPAGSALVPIGTLYRFAHNFCTGNSQNFQAQNCIGVMSQDGGWAAVSTDVMGTRGSNSPDWVSGATHTWGDYIYPQQYNGGGGTSFSPTGHDYQVTAIGGNSNPTPGTTGTAGTSRPNFDTNCTATCTDGQLTYTRQPASCNQLRGVTAWANTTLFAAGTSIFDTKTENIYYTAAGGTSGGSNPGFRTFCPDYGTCPNGGGTGSDGTVVWFNEGPNDCKSDVMLIDLISAY